MERLLYSKEEDWGKLVKCFPMLGGLTIKPGGLYFAPTSLTTDAPARKPLKIALMAAPGVGKSTILRQMNQPKEAIEPVTEIFDYGGYNLIVESMRDPAECGGERACLVELALANIRRAQMTNPNILVQERGVIDTLGIWSQIIDWSRRTPTMMEVTLAALVNLYMSLFAQFDNRVIFLKCDRETQLARIKARNYPNDRNVGVEFLNSVRENYEKFIESIPPHKALRSIDSSSLTVDETVKQIKGIIQEWKAEREKAVEPSEEQSETNVPQ